MFGIFHGDVLIGRSELEFGDPPMGVAFGRFEPTDALASLRSAMTPVSDQMGHELYRQLSGVSAKTADGTVLVCLHVGVREHGGVDTPLEWDVECLGIEYPQYAEVFPHHVKAYNDRFKE